MAIELDTNEFEKVKELFKNKYQIPAVSVLNGDFPGKVFVDNREEPQIALVFPLSRWSYISAKDISKVSNKEFIKSLFEEKILPLIKETKETSFEIYGSDDERLDNILNESLGKYIIQKHYENTFVLNKEKFDICCENMPEVDDLNIIEKKYPIIPEKYKKLTSNKNADKYVVGMVIKKNDNIISQCLNNGFTSNNYYFIDLDTFEEGNRNKSFGTKISSELIKNQFKKGLEPLWETTFSNLPSQRVAEKLGFEKVEKYPVYCIKGF